MIGIGLGVAQLRRGGVSDAPEYIEPISDDPVAPPVTEPEPPTTTPTDPETNEPEPGFDPDYTIAARIDIEDSGQTAVRTTNDPGTFGAAYIATAVSGNEYWEYDIQNSTPRGATFAIGITTLDMPLNGIPGERATEIAWWSDGTIRQGGVTLGNLGSGGAIGRGDLAGVSINGSGEVFLFKNCTALNAGASVGTLAPAGPIYPFVALYSARTRINMNFSLSRFGCAVPDGFYPIGQAPTPTGPTIAALTSVESGTWVVPAGVTTLSEVLIVAGGGAGGGGDSAGVGGAGGGGAGGIIRLTDVVVTPGASLSYEVGAGGLGIANRGNNGGSSSFNGNTAVGGGGGGGCSSRQVSTWGLAGGSGGGGGAPWSGDGLRGDAGAGTAGQGFAGGAGHNSNITTRLAGGGGGASEVGERGATTASNRGGNGGDGLYFASFADYGVAGWFGGGGGGGAGGGNGFSATKGGQGGGGIGPETSGAANGFPGTPNTGGGGSGANGNDLRPGGSGGSGVILIKY